MAERKRIHDLGELMETAAEALTSALADGDEKHPPGSWRDEDVSTQLNHIEDHLDAIRENDIGEDHFTHLICRAVMLFIHHQKEISRGI